MRTPFDKFVRNEFERPQDGPEGAASKCSCIACIHHILVNKGRDSPSNPSPHLVDSPFRGAFSMAESEGEAVKDKVPVALYPAERVCQDGISRSS
jgi:hypothetical protein